MRWHVPATNVAAYSRIVLEQDRVDHRAPHGNDLDVAFYICEIAVNCAILQNDPAIMLRDSWNDLRYLLAVSRGQTLTAAASSLGVNDTTVARRLAALQMAMGVRLVLRLPNGKLRLTPQGETAALRAEAIEREVALLAAEVSGVDHQIAGAVRLTSVPVIVDRVLVPAVGTLLQRHPALRLELVADSRDYSLTRREADLALRLARPKIGGARVKARRIGILDYAVYASSARKICEAKALPWITYDDAMDHLPQARWIAAVVAAGDGEVAHFKVHDGETALRSAIVGLGRTVLPCLIADGDTRLQRIGRRSGQPVLTREVWLLVHSELAILARIKAVTQWIEEIFSR